MRAGTSINVSVARRNRGWVAGAEKMRKPDRDPSTMPAADVTRPARGSAGRAGRRQARGAARRPRTSSTRTKRTTMATSAAMTASLFTVRTKLPRRTDSPTMKAITRMIPSDQTLAGEARIRTASPIRRRLIESAAQSSAAPLKRIAAGGTGSAACVMCARASSTTPARRRSIRRRRPSSTASLAECSLRMSLSCAACAPTRASSCSDSAARCGLPRMLWRRTPDSWRAEVSSGTRRASSCCRPSSTRAFGLERLDLHGRRRNPVEPGKSERVEP